MVGGRARVRISEQWRPGYAAERFRPCGQRYADYTLATTVLLDQDLRYELIALGLEPETGRGTGTVTALEVDFERNTAAQPLDPRQGYVVSAHVEKAGQFLRGTFDYT